MSFHNNPVQSPKEYHQAMGQYHFECTKSQAAHLPKGYRRASRSTASSSSISSASSREEFTSVCRPSENEQHNHPGHDQGLCMDCTPDTGPSEYRDEEYLDLCPGAELLDPFCSDHPDIPRHKTSLCANPAALASLRWVLEVVQEPFHFQRHPLNYTSFLRNCDTLGRFAMAAKQERQLRG